MSKDLITSKLNIPPHRPSLVPRPRLFKLLDEGLHAKRRLTLISAPAGFGKTTLVVDWLQQVDFQAAWLSLDEADNDLARFLAYLVASLQEVDEEIGAPMLNAIQSPQLPPLEKILAGLLNQFYNRANPLILA
jgi:LuxR family transcriptional regulator, maltose regulon positive regulatory protein